MTEKAPTLLAFSPMVNCEATRCVLDYYKLPYREIDRLFGWANLLTFFHGGYGEVPVLYAPRLHLSGPAPIVRRFDATLGRPRLLPPEQPLRSEIERAWAFFHNDLPAGVVRLAYFHLLPQTAPMVKSLGGPISPFGRAMLPAIYPALRSLLRLLLGLDPARLEDWRRRVDVILDAVDRHVEKGHCYLVGEHISLADIGMVSSAAPLFVPPHYARWLPPLEEFPPALASLVEETRRRPSAAYVERIYAEIGEGSHAALANAGDGAA
jgi:glutathione S-transferase